MPVEHSYCAQTDDDRNEWGVAWDAAHEEEMQPATGRRRTLRAFKNVFKF